MASWPTSASLQAKYGDLLEVPTARLDLFVADAKARVQQVMSQKYAVALWAGALVPSQAAAWVARLAHAYFQQDIHFGSAPESGSSPATTVRDQVEQEMKDLLEAGQLLDDNGVPIPIDPGPSFPGRGSQTIKLRTLRPVFDMGPRERQRVLQPDPSTDTNTSRWR